MRAYIDADILIWHLRGKAPARDFLLNLRSDSSLEPWIGAMQRAEIVFYMRPEERRATEGLLAQFETAPVDRETIDAAREIYRRWNPSHGTDPNDAILAATVKKTGGKVYCLNTKHFPMPDLVVEKAW